MADPDSIEKREMPALVPPGPAWLHWLTGPLDRGARSPAAPPAATLILLVAGLLGSVWSAEIRSAFPVDWRYTVGGHTRWFWEMSLVIQALLFWVFAFLGSALFGWREWVLARTDEASRTFLFEQAARTNRAIEARTRALGEQAQELHERGRSLPPEQFLQHSQIVNTGMHEMLKRSLLRAGFESQDVLLGEIRAALEGCVELATMFEQPERRSGRWAANVMVFVPIEAIDDFALAEYAAACPYKRLSFDRGQLAGVLWLRQDLSFAITFGDGATRESPDPEVRPMALPVPAQPLTDSLRLLRVLPGAPYALCANRPAGYPDTLELGRTAVGDCDLPPGASDEMTAYFEPATSPRVRSLVSLPLPRVHEAAPAGWGWSRPSGDRVTLLRPDQLAAGVVNIHRDQGRMACTDERLLLFHPVIVPLLGVVRDLVELHDSDARDVQHRALEPGP
ncbi:hypothetical protein [Longimicrobium sp.]|jgi:hypothetical protein|uniref:hypothetical protein n=1 Tax=Longimicrobium sp. TaxID=2029185 RepID=UPI002EDB892A